jgi:hypothetical protein
VKDNKRSRNEDAPKIIDQEQAEFFSGKILNSCTEPYVDICKLGL